MTRSPLALSPSVFAFAVAACTTLGVAASLVSVAIPTRDAVRAITDAAHAQGYVITHDGAPALRLGLRPRLHLADVRVHDDAGSLAAEAAALEIGLRPGPLLSGNIVPGALTLHDATLNLDETLIQRLRAVFDGTREAGTLPDIALVNVRLAFADGTLPLSALTGTLSQKPSSGALQAQGALTWRGETMTGETTVANPRALLAGKSSAVRVMLEGSLAHLDYTGSVTGLPVAALDGTLDVTGRSLRRAARFLGAPLPSGQGLSEFALKGAVRAAPEGHDGTMKFQAVMPDAEIMIDGNAARGTLAWMRGGARPHLQATLAADALDLTPYLDLVTLSDRRTHRWNARPLVRWDTVDLDVRLSAVRVQAGSGQFEDVSASARLNDGTYGVRLTEAAGYGGTFSLMVEGKPGLDGQTGVTLDARATGIDAGRLLSALRSYRLSGTGDVTLAFKGNGNSIADIVSTLSGQARILVNDGVANGLDLAAFLDRVQRTPLAARELAGGRTPFRQLVATITIADGVARTDDLRLVSDRATVTAIGEIDLANGWLDLTGAARQGRPQSETDTEIQNAFVLPFVARGTWSDPSLLPDTRTLLRHSGAARPLLAPRMPAGIDPRASAITVTPAESSAASATSD